MLTGGRVRRERGEEGVVGLNLAITIAFALFAVIQLTRTTIAAQQIDDRVDVIVGEVTPIGEDLTNVPKLDETDRMAAEILTAAQPLSGQAEEIINIAKSIDGNVSKIQANAGSINGTVHSINRQLSTLQPVVRSINNGVATINGQADTIIRVVAAIKADLSNVLVEVGPPGPNGHGTGISKTIHGHANGIDCNPAVAGSACER